MLANLRRLALVASLSASAALAGAAQAQVDLASQLRPPPEGMVQRVTLTDGSQLLGKVLSFEGDIVRFESAAGVSELRVGSIAAIKLERPGRMVNGAYYFPNPNATRLFYAPTGRMLSRGEGYVSDFWLFFPSVAVGVTERFTIGGGMSVFPGAGPEEQLLYITPKVAITQGPKLNTAIGALAINTSDFDNGRASAGILYGVATWGSPDNSVTGGFGYGFTDAGLASNPVVLLGAESRLSPRLSFVSENHLLPDGNVVLSGGLRLMGHGVSVDFGFVNFGFESESFWFPILGFVFKW